MKSILHPMGYCLVAVFGIVIGVVATQRFAPSSIASRVNNDEDDHAATPPADSVVLTDRSMRNLGLYSAPLRRDSTWRTIQIPGMIVDSPGHSDRGVVAPASAIITAVHRIPGETVSSGDALFTLRLVSEPLLQTQAELFKASQEIQLARAKRKRLETYANTVAAERLIEIDEQIARLEMTTRAYRQELHTRGLSLEQMDQVAAGEFATEILLAAPSGNAVETLELQELKVEMGQHVQAGQTLCILADHRHLAIEGRAFREEATLLEQAVRNGRPVEVDFLEGPAADREAITAIVDLAASADAWTAVARLSIDEANSRLPPLQPFLIRQLANVFDPQDRTFAFFIPLQNQARCIRRDNGDQMLWRFRPGQRVRLHLPVEHLDGVFVLPPEAVARDGPESFVFVQNVNTFERVPVRVLLRERNRIVIADDGDFVTGVYVAQRGAGQLNRMLKNQSGGVPKGYHVHADGSLHRNGDPEE